MKRKKNYKSDTKDKTDPNQANDEYLLSNWEAIGRKLKTTSRIV